MDIALYGAAFLLLVMVAIVGFILLRKKRISDGDLENVTSIGSEIKTRSKRKGEIRISNSFFVGSKVIIDTGEEEDTQEK